MIWNPTWKDAERNFLSIEQLNHNINWLTTQASEILERITAKTWYKFEIEVVNNYDFFKDINVVEFMREVGKYMTVNRMMNKDIVKKRITDPDKSISYAEFSYMLLMGYDFYRLFVEKNIMLEVWGSDEWDWIISGIELIGKKTWKTAYWLTNKLVLDSNGKKFWKSMGNAVWLSKQKNSPYFVYQYLMNIPDEDVERFLKLLTFMDLEEIKQISNKHMQNPELREWQKALAEYVSEMIFGIHDTQTAIKISDILFGKNDSLEILKTMSDSDIQALFRETWWTEAVSFDNDILDMMVETWIAESKWEAKKLIQWGWIYLNEKKIENIDYKISEADFIGSKTALLRKWKKTYKLIIKK